MGEQLGQLPLPQLIEHLRSPQHDPRSSAAAVEILRRFQPLLRKYWAWHRLGSYEDFVQEAMVRLFIALPKLRDAESFPGLFRRIVIGAATDALRKPKAELVNIDEIDEEQLTVGFDESLGTAVVVRSYLELLPPREQLVINLVFFEDRDFPEVARMLGITEGAVRTTKSRAVARLRELLQASEKKSGSR